MTALPLLKRFSSKPLPDDVFLELVGLMFRSVGSIGVMTGIYAASAVGIALRTGDDWAMVLAIVGVLIGLGRVALSLCFNRETAGAPLELARTQIWQVRYAAGASAFSICIGALTARALAFDDTVAHLLATVLAFSYGTGMIVRAAVRPVIAGIQVFLILFAPTLVVAFNQGTAHYAALLILQLLLLVGAWELINYLHQTIVERLLTRHELRLAKEAAEQAQARAEQASEAKTEFLATMSHEIRTPLNGILGYTDLLLDDQGLSPPQRRHAERIQSAGNALLTVVNDILDFSKIEAGQVELERLPFAPADLVDDAVSIVRGMAHKKGLALELAMAADLPERLLGDADRLRQVLLNLLNNAVKFTPAGEVVLRLECKARTHTTCSLRFSVTDTGIGIPQERQARLFQRFSQLDGSIRREFGGTGLGLAISKHLVELMGGTIGVDSTAGQGATFWFTADLAQVTDEPAVPVMPLADPHTAAVARILLVEDILINQEIARAVLGAAGHEVDVVADGAEAIMAVQVNPYDLVLMDIQMPVMDGLTATRHIRALEHPAKDLPIIAMTANVLPQQIAQFQAAGMDGHVGKPFKRDELHAAIQRWCGGTGRGRL